MKKLLLGLALLLLSTAANANDGLTYPPCEVIGTTTVCNGQTTTAIAGLALTTTTYNGNTWTAGTGTLTIAAAKTFTDSNNLTLAGTDGTTITFQGTDTYVGRATTDTFTNKTFDTAGAGNSFKINGTAITAVTGTGSAVLSVAPTLTGNTTVGTIDKVTITAPTTAATLTFGTDNATVTFQGTDTYVGRATTDTLTNKTLTSPALGGTVTGNNTIPLTILAQSATNTVLGNSTSGTANVTALAVGSCSTAASAVIWTTNAGFGCNTSITAGTNANLTGPITSVGNATSIAAQTGTGTTFVMSAGPTITGTLNTADIVATSAGANALAVGRLGSTTPALQIDASTATSITGIKIKSAATGGGVAISAIGEAANGNLTLNAQGTGTIGIGSVSTGAVTITPATTLSNALTYGGVALSNAVTGTGNMVLSISPTVTGTLTVGAITDANAAIVFSALATGTNADTVCYKADGTLLIQAAACTISSKRFKVQFPNFAGDALSMLGTLPIAQFTMKPTARPNHDANAMSLQLGLYAEDVAKMDKRCAIFEQDMKTPKSYRPECMIALLVRGTQQLTARVEKLEAANDNLRKALGTHR